LLPSLSYGQGTFTWTDGDKFTKELVHFKEMDMDDSYLPMVKWEKVCMSTTRTKKNHLY